MKKIIAISSLLIMVCSISHAFEYECKLINSDDQSHLGVFTFDTVKEPNKFIKVNNNVTIGCVKFESQSPLIACGFSHENEHYNGITDLGGKHLGISGPLNGQNLLLTCLKSN